MQNKSETGSSARDATPSDVEPGSDADAAGDFHVEGGEPEAKAKREVIKKTRDLIGQGTEKFIVER